MTSKKQDQIIFSLCFVGGVILLAGILLAVDFLYAGIQELFLPNINPEYIPATQLANRIILASSLSISIGLILFIVIIWIIVRRRRIKRQLIIEETIDEEGSIDFRSMQIEISSSLKNLRDLFGFIIIVVVITGLFTFLRFIWMISKYQAYGEYFIHRFLTDYPALIVSLTLYLVLAIMITYLLITSLQKFIRLKIISENYDNAVEKVMNNFNRLISDKEEAKDTEEKGK